jgi:uncharacterized membrane protein
MVRKSYPQNLFALIFNLGLIFLVFDIAIDFFQTGTNFIFLSKVPFSAIGFTICLTSMPFLMVEWLKLPLGTHSKRIKLYQGAGNLLALLVLTGGWIWRKEAFSEINSNFGELASLTFSSGGLLLTIIFGWLGGKIAAFVSKKHINIEKLNFMKPKTVVNSSDHAATDSGVKIPVRRLIDSVSATPARQN